MNDLIIVEYYTTKTNVIVTSFTSDTLYDMCECFELNPRIRQWRIVDIPEEALPFYQPKFWKKLVIDINNWDFS